MGGWWKYPWYKTVMDYVLNGTSYTPPTFYAGLGKWLFYTEVDAAEYQRQEVVWGPYDPGSKSGRNTNRIQFSAPFTNWGLLDRSFAFDAASGGNELIEIPLGPNNINSAFSRWIGPKAHTIFFCWNAADGDTVTIDGVAYRFVASLSQAYDVLIGTNPIDNLRRAINDDGVAGTNYHSGTVEHPTCEVPWDDFEYYGLYPQAHGDQGSTQFMPIVCKDAVSGDGNGTEVSTVSDLFWFDHPFMGGAGKPLTVGVGQLSFQIYYPAGDVSDYLAEKMYDWLTGQSSWTSPYNDLEVALYTTLPGVDDTSGVELSASGYSRQDVTFGSYSLGKYYVNHLVEWTAGENWPNINGVCIRQKSIDELLFLETQPGYSVNNGQTFGYPANSGLRVDP